MAPRRAASSSSSSASMMRWKAEAPPGMCQVLIRSTYRRMMLCCGQAKTSGPHCTRGTRLGTTSVWTSRLHDHSWPRSAGSKESGYVGEDDPVFQRKVLASSNPRAGVRPGREVIAAPSNRHLPGTGENVYLLTWIYAGCLCHGPDESPIGTQRMHAIAPGVIVTRNTKTIRPPRLFYHPHPQLMHDHTGCDHQPKHKKHSFPEGISHPPPQMCPITPGAIPQHSPRNSMLR